LNNISTLFPVQTFQESIRNGFFLTPETHLSDELMRLYQQGVETHNLQPFSQQIAQSHTDQFAIHITHDIDWLNPYHPYSFANVLRSLAGNHSWLTLKQVLRKDVFVRNIEQLLNLETELGIKAIYCIGATSGQQLGRYDIRYSLDGEKTAEIISMIRQKNQIIGLQSSYHAHQKKSLKQQLSNLESATTQKVNIHRSHYLHAPPAILYPQLHRAGIQYDIGYGTARKVGFKNGFPGKFKPIDPDSGKLTDLTVIPLILMDNIFFYTKYSEVIKQFRLTLQQLKNYNGSACISFHPENMLLKPQLYHYFEEIIHICKQEGAILNPPLTTL
jgi:hypothetical protein